MREVRAILAESGADGWTVRVADVGQSTIDELDLADFEVRRLVQEQTGESWSDAEDLDVVLVDDEGERVYAFDLLFTAYPAGDAEPDPRFEALAAAPPAGCRFERFGSDPGLRCLRRGESRFEAIASLIAEIRLRYGLDANDLGFEKLWEWAGSRDWRERMIAHLLLMAADRARWTGVPTDDLVSFLRTVMGEPATDERS
jgi:hypothetical protein